MNRVLDIYADIDSFFDYRRGLLQFLMTEGDYPETGVPFTEEQIDARKALGDSQWDMHIAKNYRDRRMDTFNYPFFGIDESKYRKILAERSLKHWAANMFYPTKLNDTLINRVIALEGLTERPIDIKKVRLFVNTFPYAFDSDMSAELVAFLATSFNGLLEVKAISSDPSAQGAKFYGQYQYVFRYNLMLDESSELLMNTFQNNPIPDTTFVVPDILVRETDTFAGTIKEWYQAAMTPLAVSLKVIPIEHADYDYRDE